MSHVPRKRFGQHFLHDPGIRGRIVDAIAPQPGNTIVEIGPGLGALTAPLLERGARVIAIELDRDVIPELQARCEALGDLEIHSLDALKLDLARLGEGPFRLVGNLPYNISTPLLFHLLAQRSRIRDMHFMLQKEVVQRLGAAPGNKTYGRLGVMAALACHTEPLFDVNPGAFRPPPAVTSSVVRLLPREMELAIPNPDLLAEIVRRAFSQRRKTLRNSLRGLVPEQLLVGQDIDPGARAETLAPEDFARLAAALDATSPPADDNGL